MRIATGAVVPSATTLVQLLRRQAEHNGGKVAFSYSDTGDDAGRVELSYAELDRKAQAIAATLQVQGAAGQRVLVFCRDGFEHIAGFFGCWYAGAIAVPIHESYAPRTTWVISDAQPAFAVTSPDMPMKLKTGVDAVVQLADEPPLRWVLTVGGDAEAWVPPGVGADTTALLMYTSGTTASPKAVVVSHRNILCNVAAMAGVSGVDEQTVGVSWMPHQHNMSLISGLIAVVNAGATGIGIASQAFVERPMRWLELISRVRATATVAPYWAYVSCVEQSTPAERAALDLSCLLSAAGGAQSTGAAEMREFAEAFAVAGFRPEAFRTAYGLTEATSSVSGSMVSTVPAVASLNQTALAQGRVVDAEPGDAAAVELLSSGLVMAGQTVVIVEPDSRLECRDDEVGEIWVAGSNVTQGYWRRPEETRATFGGVLADTGEGPFLRSGDLGFLRGGELFVVGRYQDLITIGGSKYYPDAVEATVHAAHPALLSGRGAAFAIPPKSAEEFQLDELIVVHEVDLRRVDEDDLAEISAAVRAAVGERHGVQVASVLLVAAGGLPGTALGKIRRDRCRQLVADHALATLAEWHAAQQPPSADVRSSMEAQLFNDIAAARVRRERERR